MLASLIGGIFGTKNERELKRMRKIVDQINALEPTISALSDADLSAKTPEFKERYNNGESLDKLLPEAFAVCREAAKRVMGMRHYDVQLIGGITLHEGKIAEMRTGEGKTLMGTLACYLNALSGQGVHVITVNDYLAQRDAELNRPLFEFLGLSIGTIYSMQSPVEKAEAYQADITYGTNNEFGFDYLRDNMVFSLPEKKQRGLNYAIIDEVDSILIDEARTPLIISGQSEDSSQLYAAINNIPPKLRAQKEEKVADGGHFWIDEKQRSVEMTEVGFETVEQELIAMGLLAEGESLYSASNLSLVHHVTAAIRAHFLYHRDVHYIIHDGEVIIVDEHTGRTMPGRRWSEGLHQAVEAKEGVRIQNENQTLASITFQNYFRLYEKLAGMTGTADTEAFEFQHIYGLDTVVVPTNRPMVRKDMADLVYLTANEKYQAIIKDIKDCRERGQPVLVGTVSIEQSELLARLMVKEKIPHQVLNAKFHEKEAEIVAQAGRTGAVTIATNMAGRGTDIVLGGNWNMEIEALENPTPEQKAKIKADWQVRHDEVVAAGGLHILGTERHESRRIDNQLRGRAGRQGDAGSSRFYLSMEDSLMRIFASDRVSGMMKKLGMEEGEAIEHPWVSRAIENAQRKVEARNFDIRKQLLEFDDVANDQRQVVYAQRNELMDAESIEDTIKNIQDDVIGAVIDQYIPPQSVEELWDVPGLEQRLNQEFMLKLPIQEWLDKEDDLHEESLRERIITSWSDAYKAKEEMVGASVLRQFEKAVMLQTLDGLWKEHLAAMDHLRQGIHLRGYAQKNPKQEYKRESFELFQQLLNTLKHDVISVLSKVQVQAQSDVEEMEARRREEDAKIQRDYQHAAAEALVGGDDGSDEMMAHTPMIRDGDKVGRNDPCPCGSGRKYKQCHGKLS